MFIWSEVGASGEGTAMVHMMYESHVITPLQIVKDCEDRTPFVRAIIRAHLVMLQLARADTREGIIYVCDLDVAIDLQIMRRTQHDAKQPSVLMNRNKVRVRVSINNVSQPVTIPQREVHARHRLPLGLYRV